MPINGAGLKARRGNAKNMVLKGCQRCGGDLLAEEDLSSGSFDSVCMQCGHRGFGESPVTFQERISATRAPMSRKPFRMAA